MEASWYTETHALLTRRAVQEVVDRGPPCRSCRYFEPQLNVEPHGHGGFRLCQSPDQWHDFSCFQERTEKAK